MTPATRDQQSTMDDRSLRLMIAADAHRLERRRESLLVAAIIVAALIALAGTVNVALQAGDGAPAQHRDAPARASHVLPRDGADDKYHP
jgi:hypothetical protein